MSFIVTAFLVIYSCWLTGTSIGMREKMMSLEKELVFWKDAKQYWCDRAHSLQDEYAKANKTYLDKLKKYGLEDL